MKIEYLRMKNFRQFKGENKIEFSKSDNKHITVILGENHIGKSSIIHALNWCLYGLKYDKIKSKIYNNDLAVNDDPYEIDVFVEIKIIHMEKEYTIRREKKFTKDPKKNDYVSHPDDFKIKYLENGETKTLRKDHDKAIEGILPFMLSRYFFFKGENFDTSKVKDVKKAVHGLMGLNILKSAADHLYSSGTKDSVCKKYDQSIAKLNDSNQDFNKLKADQDAERKNYDDFEKNITNMKEKLNNLNMLINEYDRIILEKSAVSDNTKRLLEIRINLKKLKSDLNDQNKLLIGLFKDSNPNYKAFTFFGLPLYKNAQVILANVDNKKNGIPSMNVEAIDYLIKRRKCLCGCNLNDELINLLNEEKERLTTAEYDKLISDFNIACKLNTDGGETFINKFQDIYEKITTMMWKKNQLESDEASLSEKLGNTDVDLAKTIDDKMNGEKEKEKCENIIKENKLKLVECKQKIDKLEADINNNVKLNAKCALIQKQKAYAYNLYKEFDHLYNYELNEHFNDIQTYINKNYKIAVGENQIVELNPDYTFKINIIRENDKITEGLGGSDGLNVIENLVFIISLIEVARDRIKNIDSENPQISTEPYPLVMDAAFSYLDGNHINNVCKIISKLSEQIVFLLMERDWEVADSALSKYVGAKYLIEAVNNTTEYSKITKLEM
ncbi:MAG: AAA family ATPase [Christensenellaceae bacterium]|jgi:DNA sulfur modification protein DndD|nr:AAA family ATPase [Christensenellaceae bacterium]